MLIFCFTQTEFFGRIIDQPERIKEVLAKCCPASDLEYREYITRYLMETRQMEAKEITEKLQPYLSDSWQPHPDRFNGDKLARLQKFLKEDLKIPEGLQTIKDWYKTAKNVPNVDFLFSYHASARKLFFDEQGNLIRYPAAILPTYRWIYEITMQAEAAPMVIQLVIAKPL